MAIKVKKFECEADVSRYTDSLLFDSGETICSMNASDEFGDSFQLDICVTGEVNVSYKEETYTKPSEFPEELKELIRTGEANRNPDVYIGNNNWFEITFSVKDRYGKELAYDGEVWEEDFSDMTPEKIKSEMLDWCEMLAERYCKRD